MISNIVVFESMEIESKNNSITLAFQSPQLTIRALPSIVFSNVYVQIYSVENLNIELLELQVINTSNDIIFYNKIVPYKDKKLNHYFSYYFIEEIKFLVEQPDDFTICVFYRDLIISKCLIGVIHVSI